MLFEYRLRLLNPIAVVLQSTFVQLLPLLQQHCLHLLEEKSSSAMAPTLDGLQLRRRSAPLERKRARELARNLLAVGCGLLANCGGAFQHLALSMAAHCLHHAAALAKSVTAVTSTEAWKQNLQRIGALLPHFVTAPGQMALSAISAWEVAARAFWELISILNNGSNDFCRELRLNFIGDLFGNEECLNLLRNLLEELKSWESCLEEEGSKDGNSPFLFSHESMKLFVKNIPVTKLVLGYQVMGDQHLTVDDFAVLSQRLKIANSSLHHQERTLEIGAMLAACMLLAATFQLSSNPSMANENEPSVSQQAMGLAQQNSIPFDVFDESNFEAQFVNDGTDVEVSDVGMINSCDWDKVLQVASSIVETLVSDVLMPETDSRAASQPGKADVRPYKSKYIIKAALACASLDEERLTCEAQTSRASLLSTAASWIVMCQKRRQYVLYEVLGSPRLYSNHYLKPFFSTDHFSRFVMQIAVVEAGALNILAEKKQQEYLSDLVDSPWLVDLMHRLTREALCMDKVQAGGEGHVWLLHPQVLALLLLLILASPVSTQRAVLLLLFQSLEGPMLMMLEQKDLIPASLLLSILSGLLSLMQLLMRGRDHVPLWVTRTLLSPFEQAQTGMPVLAELPSVVKLIAKMHDARAEQFLALVAPALKLGTVQSKDINTLACTQLYDYVDCHSLMGESHVGLSLFQGIKREDSGSVSGKDLLPFQEPDGLQHKLKSLVIAFFDSHIPRQDLGIRKE